MFALIAMPCLQTHFVGVSRSMHTFSALRRCVSPAPLHPSTCEPWGVHAAVTSVPGCTENFSGFLQAGTCSGAAGAGAGEAVVVAKAAPVAAVAPLLHPAPPRLLVRTQQLQPAPFFGGTCRKDDFSRRNSSR